MKSKKPVIITVFLAVVVICAIAATLQTAPNNNLPRETLASDLPMGNYTLIRGEEDQSEGSLSDLYLWDHNTDVRIHAGKFLNVSTNYYLGTSIDQTLYILKDNPNTAHKSLWKYQPGTKPALISEALDFRVSNDQKMIAIETLEHIIILNDNNKQIAKFSYEDLKASHDSRLYNFSGDGFYNDELWIENRYTTAITGLTKIDTRDSSLVKYPLEINAFAEYHFNPANRSIVYSDIPAFFDLESYEEFMKQKEPVTLQIYNIDTKTNRVIMKDSIEFRPKWIDENTIEINTKNETRENVRIN